MKRNTSLAFLVLVLSASSQLSASADTFGSGANSFDIDFVTIGNPGNPADTTGIPNPAGSVPYVYRIGKYEISEQMIDKANAVGGLGISKDTRGPNKPATSINWYEAAHFVNWLNTSTGNSAAYKFDDAGAFQFWSPSDPGYDPSNVFRNGLAKYYLPSIDEWYKAAYYDPAHSLYADYPTGSDIQPAAVAMGVFPGTAVYAAPGPADITQAGGLSPFGTMAQGGNAFEWMETDTKPSPVVRSLRGGSWGTSNTQMTSLWLQSNVEPYNDYVAVGFRVGSIVPEPSAMVLLDAVLAAILIGRARYSSGARKRDAN